MKVFNLIVILGLSMQLYGQSTDSLRNEILVFQKEQNDHYKDKEESPLTKKERKHFKGHRFYPINLLYRVTAHFEPFSNPDTVVMPTSAGTEKVYLKYAMLHFNIAEQHCHLVAYQSVKLMQKEEYKDYLFVPFRDNTSGKTSYGGGRYLDITIPEGNEVVLNFNLAYNPYCAYTNGWFCSIPPEENTLAVEINAGLMAPEEH
ncbi:MAG: DUF1684 domain-containing protein [Crocinitomicaceae bacterium]|nr:DUF1684 domain-containing protein [Crocinitomicaceae bacterium]